MGRLAGGDPSLVRALLCWLTFEHAGNHPDDEDSEEDILYHLPGVLLRLFQGLLLGRSAGLEKL